MNENSAWLREKRQKAQLEAERAVAERQQAAAAASEEPPAKGHGSRKRRSCSICRAAGLGDEALGHISTGHDAWLAKQAPHLRAHFSGQGATTNRTLRLLRNKVGSGSDDDRF